MKDCRGKLKFGRITLVSDNNYNITNLGNAEMFLQGKNDI